MRWILALMVLLSTVLVFMPVYQRRLGHAGRWGKLVCKGFPTLMCAAFAGTAYFCGGDRYSLLIFLGLCVCTAADVLLDVHFVTGGVLFFAGHLFYMSAFCTQQPPTWWSLPVFAAAFALLWLFLQRFRSGIRSAGMYCCVLTYGAALSVVLGLSLPMPFLGLSERTLLSALGAAVFVLSDMGVCHSVLGKVSLRRNAFYLGIYYLAQLLLGLSAF